MQPLLQIVPMYEPKFIFQPIPHIITYYIYLSELVPVPTMFDKYKWQLFL